MRQEVSSVKFIIVGEGSCKQELENYVRNKNINNIIFVGEIENDKIPDLLAYSDVFILGSHYEGSPTVIKEAMACNTAVVSLDVGDVREILKNTNGCLIAKNDIYDFSEKIIKVLLSLSGVNTRDAVMRYSYENIGNETLKIYNQLREGK